MCLLIFAHQVSSEYPLLVAANRDEFHARPTAESTFWADYPNLLAGRDLQQGGTWMGVTRSGRFAAVTNYRDPARTADAPRSRGELPLQYLTSSQTPAEFLNRIAAQGHDFAGFNLLVGDRTSLWYYANNENESPRSLSPGIYGLSNASLDTPWPKVALGKTKLQSMLATNSVSHQALTDIVSDRHLASQLSLSEQGLDGEMDRVLSPQFIVTDTYGTRSCTTFSINSQGQADWLEQSFNGQGVLSGLQHQTFWLGKH